MKIMKAISNMIGEMAEKTAETSVDMCPYWGIEETEMPSELIERD